jgi:SAM-dependent methyltransferase
MKEAQTGAHSSQGDPPAAGTGAGRLRTLGLLTLLAAVSVLPEPGAALPRLAYFFRDLSVTFYPVRLFAARELQAGRIPVWNPYIFEGSFALPYFHVLDLAHILWPGPEAFSFLLTLQFPIAAIGAFALLRALGAGRAGAFVAGAVYALGGLAQSSANLYIFLQALALAPVIVLTLRRAAIEGGRLIPVAAMASAAGLATLAVEFVGQAILLGVAWAVVERPKKSSLIRLGGAVLLGLGLAGVAVFPALGILPQSARGGGFAASAALAHAVPPLAFLQVLVPDLFGSVSDPVQIWWGARFFSRLPYFLSLYLGPVVLALGWVGFVELSRRQRIFLGSAALIGLWVALGAHGGLAPPLLETLRVFRYPSKALLTAYLVAAVLAGLGVERLHSGAGWHRLRNACVALVVLTLLPVAGLLWASESVRYFAALSPDTYPAVRHAVMASAGLSLAVGVTVAVLAAVVHRGRFHPKHATALLATIVVVDLVRVHAGMNPQVDASFYRLVPELQAQRLDSLGGGRVFSFPLETSSTFVRYLAGRPPHLRLSAFFINRQLLLPYLNVIDRVFAPEAKDLTSFSPRPPDLQEADYRPDNLERLVPWMRQAAVSRVLSLDALEHASLRLSVSVPAGPPGLEIHVYELRDPAPFAYLACRVETASSSEEAARRALSAGFDLARDVVVEGTAHASCTKGGSRLERFEPAQRRYAVEGDGAGVLVERENFASGWKARVDGREASVIRVNGKHRGVAVPGGPHIVDLRYEAPLLDVGLAASLLGLVVTGVLLFRPRRDAPLRTMVERPRDHGRRDRAFIRCPACGGGLPWEEASICRCFTCGAQYPRTDGILDLSRGREGPPGYDRHYFGTLPQVEETHFWFVHRREIILEALRRHVPQGRALFDVGCGSGGLLAFLERSGVPMLGACDAYIEGLQVARRRLSAPLIRVGETGPPPLLEGRELIGFFDVLEHLDDDLGMLRWTFSTLEPGGAVVITVPAHPSLFDEMDELAHHRRRYTRAELHARLVEAGFEVRHLAHFMALLAPSLMVVRALGRLLLGPRWSAAQRRDAELRVTPGLNEVLRLALRVEGALGRLVPWPFGTSLIAVAVRPAPPPDAVGKLP